MTGREATVSWAAPCVSGRGENLDPNRFGYLIAANEDLNKVYFVTKSFFGDPSKTMEIDKASLEHKLLCDELHLHGKDGWFTFKFDRGRDKGDLCPSLRTGLADFRHPALQLVVSFQEDRHAAVCACSKEYKPTAEK